MNTETQLVIKRVYEAAEPDDGFRVLIDRLWPRGVSKERARLDLWDKDVAPSTELRRAWHSDPEERSEASFAHFSQAYRDELLQSPASEALEGLLDIVRTHDRVTLLYGAHDPEINHAVVLREVMLERLG